MTLWDFVAPADLPGLPWHRLWRGRRCRQVLDLDLQTAHFLRGGEANGRCDLRRGHDGPHARRLEDGREVVVWDEAIRDGTNPLTNYVPLPDETPEQAMTARIA
jgi:hypothetical protein